MLRRYSSTIRDSSRIPSFFRKKPRGTHVRTIDTDRTRRGYADRFLGDSVTAGGVQGGPGELPQRLTLTQNYPNPFNPTTTIRFAVPQSGHVTLKVYDMLGREIATLVDGEVAAGSHSVVWNARDDSGRSVASGSYMYRLRSADADLSRLLTIVK